MSKLELKSHYKKNETKNIVSYFLSRFHIWTKWTLLDNIMYHTDTYYAYLCIKHQWNIDYQHVKFYSKTVEKM